MRDGLLVVAMRELEPRESAAVERELQQVTAADVLVVGQVEALQRRQPGQLYVQPLCAELRALQTQVAQLARARIDHVA